MKPYYQDDQVTLYHGDCFDVLAQLPDASVDAVVCDPPYGLEFMGKDWDSPDKVLRTASRAVARPDAPGGIGPANGRPSFLGGLNPKCTACNRWQRGANPCRCSTPSFTDERGPRLRAFQMWCEQWAAECLRVLKPGGYMLAFGGSRTWHRLASAIEDAGFEIRDSIAWLYGSGFPKSLDVSKAIDKRPGAVHHREFALHLVERREAAGLSRADVSERIVGTRSGACWNWEHHQFPEAKWWPALRDLLGMDGARWDAVIAEAERERIGTRTTGIGTGRGSVAFIGDGDNRDITAPATDAAKQWSGWGTALKPAFEPIVVARKPLAGTVAANVLEHGTGAINIDACRVGSEQRTNPAGGSSSLQRVSRVQHGYRDNLTACAGEPSTVTGRWPTNVVLDESQAAELDAQTGITTSRKGKPRTGANGHGWGMTATGAEYDDAGGASRFFPVFRYEAKAPGVERPSADGVAHPTVKPLDLMRWLVRLVTPPNGVVLDPFAGSGTTAEACIHEHMRCITIEREADYLPLIVARLTKPMEVGFDFGEGA
ncbi:methyltransferase [Mycobacterium phage MooMoo]|uniref:DNA methylase n=1 Tax=Mycobacterium phage MooMoo TaxID=2108127 RepID=A0A2P1JRA9_9CAUD|nr:methyltransferase [Mycobacterium phage MooMoo]AVO21670.1 DNA methylase [Mycobacterium phage MooMoo]